jgi:hypothetical protein
MKLKRNAQVVRLGIRVMAILLLQWMMLRAKVPTIPEAIYKEDAVDLRVTPKWRYGYAMLHHGAILVRTRNTSNQPTDIPSGPHDEIWSAMDNEFRLIPTKTILESLLYLSLLVYALYGSSWLTDKIVAEKKGPLAAFVTKTILWMVAWTIASSPLLVGGYGEPLYSTWIGPGALSYSGPYWRISSGCGLTVSYRPFIEIIATGPRLCAVLIGDSIKHLPKISDRAYLWIAGLIFYGTSGFVLGVFQWLVQVRAAKRRAYN